MIRFVALCLCFIMASSIVADDHRVDEGKKKANDQALEVFTGTWEITSSKPDGVVKEARCLQFRKDMTYSALDKDGKELWAGTFNLGPTTTPKIWDHRSHEAQIKGGDALGIYELNGDKLKVACVVGTWSNKEWKGKSRPKEFTLPNADVVLDLIRVKAGK